MTVRISPCHGCPLRNGCEQREEFRKRVLGLGLRSARFRCAKLDSEMRPGRRILTWHPVKVWEKSTGYDDYEQDSFEMKQHETRATIFSAHDDRFACVIDADQDELAIEEDKYRFRRRRRHTRIIRFLDEPDRAVCHAGHVMTGGKCDSPDTECKRGPKSGPDLDLLPF